VGFWFFVVEKNIVDEKINVNNLSFVFSIYFFIFSNKLKFINTSAPLPTFVSHYKREREREMSNQPTSDDRYFPSVPFATLINVPNSNNSFKDTLVCSFFSCQATSEINSECIRLKPSDTYSPNEANTINFYWFCRNCFNTNKVSYPRVPGTSSFFAEQKLLFAKALREKYDKHYYSRKFFKKLMKDEDAVDAILSYIKAKVQEFDDEEEGYDEEDQFKNVITAVPLRD
jgi:hypothetical protein